MKKYILILVVVHAILYSCGNRAGNAAGPDGTTTDAQYAEGKDYLIYERVRLLDSTGFTEPQEAYSILLPKGWKHEDDIIWNQPGSSCAGTFKKMKAGSPDGQYELEMLPDIIYAWNSNPEVLRFNQSNGSSPYCETREPIEAEAYLRNVFAAEIGNPEIVEVESNPYVIDRMKQQNESSMQELRQYGAGDMQFNQTAVNARVKWKDGREGMITVGSNILEMMVPNIYDGTYGKIYTTQITQRTVFKYPSKESDAAKNQFSMIMSSFRSNPAWNDAVNRFWKEARQRSNTVHVGRIKMMDEQTRRIGEQAIRNGQQRLNDMDAQMRNWEASQASQDRMHTEFIKTIREVENFRDETGKYEMTSGYDHVWSRGDGSSFILSDNPNFDPSSVFQDQQWKQMKKVQ